MDTQQSSSQHPTVGSRAGWLLALCLVVWAAAPGLAQPTSAALSIQAEAPETTLRGTSLKLNVSVKGLEPGSSTTAVIAVDGEAVAEVTLEPGEQQVVPAGFRLSESTHRITLDSPDAPGVEAELEVTSLPGWLALAPPLIAISLALIFKDVLLALFAGVFVGAMTLNGWNPIAAIARTSDQYLVGTLADDTGKLKIIVFSLFLGGMVGLISKSGGTKGIVERLAPYATSGMRGQLATWLMGLFIFFDDYANSLIVGSTMRPVTDRLKISREKLAYIVDSTAAPISSVIPISTWIGFEIGLIAAAFQSLELDFNAYSIFIASIPYRFYPIFALVMGLTIALSGRDWGPMLAAERRARKTGEVIQKGDTPLADYATSGMAPPEGTPLRAINAALPIFMVIGVTLIGLWRSGVASLAGAGQGRGDFDSTLGWAREVFSNADSYNALLWASLAGLLTAFVLPVGQRILSLRVAGEGMLEGFKAMLMAIVVLVLAWGVGAVCTELNTAEYLVGATEGMLSPRLVPLLAFGLSALIAFATGTSWGTMGILIPLVIPVAHGLSVANGMPVGPGDYMTILLGTVSSVLAGSIWGDHCSPISDTTILSSMASGCDHIAHVRTQLPYAMAIGVLGMLIGDLPTAWGLSPWVSLVAGSAIIVGGVMWFGKKSAVPA